MPLWLGRLKADREKLKIQKVEVKLLAKALENSATLLNSYVPDTSAERCSGKIWVFHQELVG